MKLHFPALLLAPICLLAVSCQTKSPARDFLAWSMDQHKSLKSYSSKCEWRVEGGVMGGDVADRTISYQSPNLFQIVSAKKGGDTLTTVSDGEKLVDYSSDESMPGQTYDAPVNLSTAQSVQVKLPMGCGSLLYRFFGGSEKISALVDDSKGSVQDAGVETLPNGDSARLIKFFAKDAYGNTTVAIDEKTGMVHRITYDSATLLENVKKLGAPAEQAQPYTTSESYSDVKVNPTIEASAFVAKLPKTMKLGEEIASRVFSGGPFTLGAEAPDFTVATMDGKELKLSSLRGKPVFIDFWATWCPPCRESLPHTNKLAKEFGDKISVLAISNESKDTIERFMKNNEYTFPSYRDPDNKAFELYKVDGIPTFVVIDENGKVVAYESGYGGNEPLDKALAKVGITM